MAARRPWGPLPQDARRMVVSLIQIGLEELRRLGVALSLELRDALLVLQLALLDGSVSVLEEARP